MSWYVNGEQGGGTGGSVSIRDRGFTRGEGLFETWRVYERKPFAWLPHLQRMERGCTRLRLPNPDLQKLTRIAKDLIANEDFGDGILKAFVSRGPSEHGLHIPETQEPSLAMSYEPLPRALQTGPCPPCRLGVIDLDALGVAIAVPGCKTTHYIPNTLALDAAKEQGFDDALMQCAKFGLMEATAGNFFVKREGWWRTPALTQGILSGITRSVVIEMLKTSGFDCWQGVMEADDLKNAEAAMVVSTVREVVPVSQLNDHNLPIAETLEFQERISRYTRAHAGWDDGALATASAS